MGVNPDTNRIEELHQELDFRKVLQADVDDPSTPLARLLRPDGSPVPETWTVLKQGELVDIKGYTFRIAYIGETAIMLEPVKPTDAILPSGGGS